jgi:beta-aspartyl-peptidase (threonine type)
MKRFILLFFIISLVGLNVKAQPSTITKNKGYVIVLHGGAGDINLTNTPPDKQAALKLALNEALMAGKKVLSKGGTSLDAVVAAIKILEDSPLFNAGKGAVLNAEGKAEMDASIMDGKTLKAGAVAEVTIIKNPITAARAVMDHSEHVMLAGKGAEQFAREQHLEIVDPAYFITPERFKSYLRMKALADSAEKVKEKFGTVGAVALDLDGNLAAATSTGGMMMKKFGRVGDSPIIGAGTYANNEACAVSSTGHGEFFIRYVVAYDIAAMMLYKDWSLTKASDYVINQKLKAVGGEGGVICLDRQGNIATPFNTPGMFRAWLKFDGKNEEVKISFFKE